MMERVYTQEDLNNYLSKSQELMEKRFHIRAINQVKPNGVHICLQIIRILPTDDGVIVEVA